MVFSPPATWSTAGTAKRSPPPRPAAEPHSTRSAGSLNHTLPQSMSPSERTTPSNDPVPSDHCHRSLAYWQCQVDSAPAGQLDVAPIWEAGDVLISMAAAVGMTVTALGMVLTPGPNMM